VDGCNGKLCAGKAPRLVVVVVEGGGIDDEALELSISSTSHSDGDDDILVVLRVSDCTGTR
jgi:hypothetical protein